jgi:hypothetical protein
MKVGSTFKSVMRKDKINMNRFTDIDPSAKDVLNRSDDKDVFHLTVSMNSPMKLISAQKITHDLFDKLLQEE